MTAERLKPLGPAQRCSLCHEALVAEPDDLAACPGCDTTYHRGCLDELGGCATRGCSGGERRPMPETRPARPAPVAQGPTETNRSVERLEEHGELRVDPYWSAFWVLLSLVVGLVLVIADLQRWPLDGLRVELEQRGVSLLKLGLFFAFVAPLAYPAFVYLRTRRRRRTSSAADPSPPGGTPKRSAP